MARIIFVVSCQRFWLRPSPPVALMQIPSHPATPEGYASPADRSAALHRAAALCAHLENARLTAPDRDFYMRLRQVQQTRDTLLQAVFASPQEILKLLGDVDTWYRPAILQGGLVSSLIVPLRPNPHQPPDWRRVGRAARDFFAHCQDQLARLSGTFCSDEAFAFAARSLKEAQTETLARIQQRAQQHPAPEKPRAPVIRLPVSSRPPKAGNDEASEAPPLDAPGNQTPR